MQLRPACTGTASHHMPFCPASWGACTHRQQIMPRQRDLSRHSVIVQCHTCSCRPGALHNRTVPLPLLRMCPDQWKLKSMISSWRLVVLSCCASILVQLDQHLADRDGVHCKTSIHREHPKGLQETAGASSAEVVHHACAAGSAPGRHALECATTLQLILVLQSGCGADSWCL